MLHTPMSLRGMVTSPHHLASEAGLRVLREGGNAVEATVAMAASLAVVYPHMTAIGGDGFWLISQGHAAPVAIDASGGAAAAASAEFYAAQGHNAVPWRGPLAANTVAGTISGWGEALRLSAEIGGKLPLSRLVEDAVWSAENGFAVTRSQQDLTASKLAELRASPGFVDTFLIDGRLPQEGELMRLPALGQTLRRLGVAGTEDFYRGRLAREIAADLASVGSPVSAADRHGGPSLAAVQVAGSESSPRSEVRRDRRSPSLSESLRHSDATGRAGLSRGLSQSLLAHGHSVVTSHRDPTVDPSPAS